MPIFISKFDNSETGNFNASDIRVGVSTPMCKLSIPAPVCQLHSGLYLLENAVWWRDSKLNFKRNEKWIRRRHWSYPQNSGNEKEGRHRECSECKRPACSDWTAKTYCRWSTDVASLAAEWCVVRGRPSETAAKDDDSLSQSTTRRRTTLTETQTLCGVRVVWAYVCMCVNQSINQSKHISIAPYVASESEAHDDGN